MTFLFKKKSYQHCSSSGLIVSKRSTHQPLKKFSCRGHIYVSGMAKTSFAMTANLGSEQHFSFHHIRGSLSLQMAGLWRSFLISVSAAARALFGIVIQYGTASSNEEWNSIQKLYMPFWHMKQTTEIVNISKQRIQILSRQWQFERRRIKLDSLTKSKLWP